MKPIISLKAWTSNKIKLLVTLLAISLFVGAISSQFNLYSLEFSLYDLAFQMLPTARTTDEAVVVKFDKTSKDRFGMELNLDEVSTFLTEIAKAKPKVVLLFITIDHSRITEKQIETFNLATKKINKVIWPYEDGPVDGRPSIHLIKEKLTNVDFRISGYSFDGLSYAADRVSRRWLMSLNFGDIDTDLIAAVKELKGADFKIKNHTLVETRGYLNIFIRPRLGKQLKALSFTDVYDGHFQDESLNNKIVILGRATGDWSEDYTKSSLEKEPYIFSKLDHMGSALTCILNNDPINRVESKLFSALISSTLVFLALVIVFALPPSLGMPVLAIGLALFFALVLTALHFFQIWLPVCQAIASVIVTYAIVLPFRLVHESKQLLYEQTQKSNLSRSIEISRMSAKNILADREFRMALQVAHDIRAPISALKALESVLADKIEPQFMDVLKATINRINRIADDLLAANKNKANGNSNTPLCDIRTALSDLIDSYRLSWKNCTFSFKCNEISISTSIDSSKLERAISNLLNNAIEAHPNKSASIKISLAKQHENVVIEISDNGGGIPPAHQDKLFQQGNSFGKTGGHGLGLNQAKGVFKDFGGDLILKSSSDQGTTFQGHFPLFKKNAMKEVRLKKRVVVADDSPEALTAMKDLLIAKGHEVIACSSCQQCEQEILNQPDGHFSLFTDLVFLGEEKNGFDLLNQAAKVTGSFGQHCICSTIADTPEIEAAAKKLQVQLITKDQLGSLKIHLLV